MSTAISYTYNPRTPYKILMKGRPDEPSSWQSIAVYDREEYREYRQRGWKLDREFMEMADRARRKEV